MFRLLRQSVMILIVLTAITGVIYPLIITGIAQLLFPHQANASLITSNGKVAGSELIGQPFHSPGYFWPRPSATSPPYNGAGSGGSNMGPLNPDLANNVRERVNDLKAADPTHRSPVPVDLVTASASGLDPDISLAAAEYQVPRVAKARNMDESKVRALVAQYTSQRQLRFLGESRVNVLQVNLALDRLQPQS